jgi:hypothetical protein
VDEVTKNLVIKTTSGDAGVHLIVAKRQRDCFSVHLLIIAIFIPAHEPVIIFKSADKKKKESVP